MARIFTDGAENGDTTFWSNPTNITVTTTDPLSGARSYVASNPGGIKGWSSLSELFWRIRLKHVSNHSMWFEFRNNTSMLMQVQMDKANNRYSIYNNANGVTTYGVIGSVDVGNSHLLEIHYKIHDTAGIIDVKVNGLTVVSVNNVDTLQGGNSVCDNVYLSTSYTSYSIYMDDIAMNDTTGSVDNSWCGDGKIVALVPEAAGDSTQWTPSAGSNYQCTDEIPPSDSDYVQSANSGDKDNYNLSGYTLVGSEVIKRVWAVGRAKDILSTGSLKIGLKTHSVDYTVLKSIGTSFERVESSVYLLNPNTNADWTQDEINALQATIEMP